MDFESIRAEVIRTNAGWEPKRTHLSELSKEDLARRLGFVPKPGSRSLEEREQDAAAKASAPAAFAAIALPASFDWRDAGGQNYITPVRDQLWCGSCVAFGVLATAEAQLQISAGAPNPALDLSEADLFYCIAEAQQGRSCDGPNGGWWPADALAALQSQGVVDEACFPYTAGDQRCNKCADAPARITKIASFSTLTSVAAMKSWLASTGPLVTTLSVYRDFVQYGSGVYKHVTGELIGGHCVCVVGYDDGQSCWIVKNSWHDTWGMHGFGYIAYGEVGIDSTMYGVQV